MHDCGPRPPPFLPPVSCTLFQPIFPCGKAPLPRLHSFPIKPASSDSNYSNYSSQGCEREKEREAESRTWRVFTLKRAGMQVEPGSLKVTPMATTTTVTNNKKGLQHHGNSCKDSSKHSL